MFRRILIDILEVTLQIMDEVVVKILADQVSYPNVSGKSYRARCKCTRPHLLDADCEWHEGCQFPSETCRSCGRPCSGSANVFSLKEKQRSRTCIVPYTRSQTHQHTTTVI